MKKYDVVVVSGGFDPVHQGHVKMFKAAKAMGRRVFCGLNSDRWLVEKKGFTFMNWKERAYILSAMYCVDEVIGFDDRDGTAVDLLVRIQRLFPESTIAFANGGDRTNENTPEQGFCDAYNIDMLWDIGGGKIQSSSDLVERAQNLKDMGKL